MLIEKLNLKASPADLFAGIAAMPYSILLESQKFSKGQGRYSFLLGGPEVIFSSSKDLIRILRRDKTENIRGNPFSALRELLREFKVGPGRRPSVFSGMAAGYFGYELRYFIEKLPYKSIDEFSLPDCMLGFYRQAVIYDHLTQEIYYVNTAGRRKDGPSLKEIISQNQKYKKICPGKREEFRGSALRPGLESNFRPGEYIKAVNRVKQYISDGDIYQANLAQRFCADAVVTPYTLYRRLRRINPVNFGAYLNLKDFNIISASPERFLKLSGRCVETRPMKGTRPRGQTRQQDDWLKNDLLASGKDRAELVMIVDLERNDLGRVCEVGTVQVRRLRVLEKYSTLYQTAATVSGHLKKDKDAIDLLCACFPGGSITGAPKIRAMEIIDEIEPARRAVYTGAIGYIDFRGNMDLSIAIRTIVARDNRVCFHVGGGVVADSEPAAEYQETLDKAKALLMAIAGN